MTRHYEITDGTLHVGWASEDYMFTKMDERVLKGEASFNFHVGDAVNIVPVEHGHWERFEGDLFMCSYCKSKEAVPTCNGEPIIWTYCPYCGAKMDVSDTNVGKTEVEDER